VSGNKRYYQQDYRPDKTPLPEHVYAMGRGWFVVRLPDRWIGTFFGLENAMKAKRKALNER
jgi:hypothetical protein